MSNEAEIVPWLSSCQDTLLGGAQRVGKQQLCGEDMWEQISTSGGLSMCKAVVSGRGIVARVCKEMASVVSAQLFLESAQLPPRNSQLFLRDSCTQTPESGCSSSLKGGDIFLEV